MAVSAPQLASISPNYAFYSGGGQLSLFGSDIAYSAADLCVYSVLVAPVPVNLTTAAVWLSAGEVQCAIASIEALVTNDLQPVSALVSLQLSAPMDFTIGSLPFVYYGSCRSYNLCSTHGTCVLGSCACFPSYTGLNCSVTSAPPLLSAINSTNSQPAQTVTETLLAGVPFQLPIYVLEGTSPISYQLALQPQVTGLTLDTSNAGALLLSWASPDLDSPAVNASITASNTVGSSSVLIELNVVTPFATSVQVVSTLLDGLYLIGPVNAVLLGGSLSLLPTAAHLDLTVSDQPVVVSVEHAGSTRYLDANTDASGHFSVQFTPYPEDSGLYNVGAGPTANAGAIQASFHLLLLNAQPTSTSLILVTGTSQELPVSVLTNPSDVDYDGVQLTSVTLQRLLTQAVLQSYSLSLVNMSSGQAIGNVLPAMSSVILQLTVTSSNSPQYFSESVSVLARTSLGLYSLLDVTLQLQPPHSQLSLSSTGFTLIMTPGSIQSVSTTLTNLGSASTGVIVVACPVEGSSSSFPTIALSSSTYIPPIADVAVPITAALVNALEQLNLVPAGVSLASNASFLSSTLASFLLPPLAASSAGSVSLGFSVVANEGVDVMQTYSLTCAVLDVAVSPTAAVASSTSLTVQVELHDSHYTNVSFQAVDELTYFNSSAPGVADAVVTLSQGPFTYSVQADGNGSALFTGIPFGSYNAEVEALDHAASAFTLSVYDGIGQQLVFLRYQPVSYVFTVEQSVYQDVITVQLDAVFSTSVPIPVVTISPNTFSWSELELGIVSSIQFTVSNLGLIEALNVDLTLSHPYLRFAFPPGSNPISVLSPNTSVQLPMQVIYPQVGSPSSSSSSSTGVLAVGPGSRRLLVAPSSSSSTSAVRIATSVGTGMMSTFSPSSASPSSATAAPSSTASQSSAALSSSAVTAPSSTADSSTTESSTGGSSTAESSSGMSSGVSSTPESSIGGSSAGESSAPSPPSDSGGASGGNGNGDGNDGNDQGGNGNGGGGSGGGGCGCSAALTYQEPCATTPTQGVPLAGDTSGSACLCAGGGGGGGLGGWSVGAGGSPYTGAVSQQNCGPAPPKGPEPPGCKVATQGLMCVLCGPFVGTGAGGIGVCFCNLGMSTLGAFADLVPGEALEKQLAALGKFVSKQGVPLAHFAFNNPLDDFINLFKSGGISTKEKIMNLVAGLLTVASLALFGASLFTGVPEGLLLADMVATFFVDLSTAFVDLFNCIHDAREAAGGGAEGAGRRLLQLSSGSDAPVSYDSVDQMFINATQTGVSQASSQAINPTVLAGLEQMGMSSTALLVSLYFCSVMFGSYTLPLLVDFSQPSMTTFLNSMQTFGSDASDGGAIITQAEYAQLFSPPFTAGFVANYSQSLLGDLEHMVQRANRTVYYYSLDVYTLEQAEAAFNVTADAVDVSSLQANPFTVSPPQPELDFIYYDQAYLLITQANNSVAATSTDFDQQLDTAINSFQIAAPSEQQGVCAQVTVQLTKQVLTAGVEDFIATLELSNDQSVPLDAVSVQLVITAGNASSAQSQLDGGSTANSLFFIQSMPSSGLSGGDADLGTAVIAAGGTGTFQWLILPFHNAAPTSSNVVYQVSGDFTYTQDGVNFSVPLLPATIVVYPSPTLQLDYFLPTIVYGDDPFTPQVEPSVPFCVGLLLSNAGPGSLLSLSLQSTPPVILDNEKQLLISFVLVGSAVDGQPVVQSALQSAISVGAVGAEVVVDYSDAFTVSLMGSFISYNVTLTETLASLDQRLAIVSGLTKHSLVQKVFLPALNRSAYLADDLPDPPQPATDPFSLPIPDTLHVPVVDAVSRVAANLSVDAFVNDSLCVWDTSTFSRSYPAVELTVPMSALSSVYYRCSPPSFPSYVELDPVLGLLPLNFSLLSARQQGVAGAAVLPASTVEVGVSNVWLTSRTIRPVHSSDFTERYFHLFDPQQVPAAPDSSSLSASGSVTYVVTLYDPSVAAVSGASSSTSSFPATGTAESSAFSSVLPPPGSSPSSVPSPPSPSSSSNSHISTSSNARGGLSFSFSSVGSGSGSSVTSMSPPSLSLSPSSGSSTSSSSSPLSAAHSLSSSSSGSSSAFASSPLTSSSSSGSDSFSSSRGRSSSSGGVSSIGLSALGSTLSSTATSGVISSSAESSSVQAQGSSSTAFSGLPLQSSGTSGLSLSSSATPSYSAVSSSATSAATPASSSTGPFMSSSAASSSVSGSAISSVGSSSSPLLFSSSSSSTMEVATASSSSSSLNSPSSSSSPVTAGPPPSSSTSALSSIAVGSSAATAVFSSSAAASSASSSTTYSSSASVLSSSSSSGSPSSGGASSTSSVRTEPVSPSSASPSSASSSPSSSLPLSSAASSSSLLSPASGSGSGGSSISGTGSSGGGAGGSSSSGSLSSTYSSSSSLCSLSTSSPAPASSTGSSPTANYNVTLQSAAFQTPHTYEGTSNREYRVGPFANNSLLFGDNDSPDYAGTWQIPITFPMIFAREQPFTFPFFGRNYSAITLTSKGFMYLGSYGSEADLGNLPSVAAAPDYSSPSSAGFPTVNGQSRSVISFLQSAGGAVSVSSVINYGEGSCLNGTGECTIKDYFYEILPPITSYETTTTVQGQRSSHLVTMTPANSQGTPADGYRFVLLALPLVDTSGVSAEVIVVLYESGLIEMFYYAITLSGNAPTGQPPASTASGLVSVGIQGVVNGTAIHYSTPINAPCGLILSQQPYVTFSKQLSNTAISFRPL